MRIEYRGDTRRSDSSNLGKDRKRRVFSQDCKNKTATIQHGENIKGARKAFKERASD